MTVPSALARGKHVGRLRKSSNVVIIDQQVSDLSPNEAAVKAAWGSRAELAKRTGSKRRR